MPLRGDDRTVPGGSPSADGRAGGDRPASYGDRLEAFRDELMRSARREIGPDLAAKVSASDIVQETFLAAGRDMTQFQGAGPVTLRAWLRGILRNLMSNTRRRYRESGKRRVGREVGAGDTAALWATLSASATPPSGHAMRREREVALHRALLTLPSHYREVIRWHHQDRLTFDAIGGRLGISTDAARKVWGRALLRLREALGPGHDPR